LRVGEILERLDEVFPWELAEEWDNSGLQVGSEAAECSGILCAVDPSNESIEAASCSGCNVLLTHHPLFFKKGVNRIDLGTPVGTLVKNAVEKGVNIISCHTNADSAEKGIASFLARSIGLEGFSPVEGSKRSRFVKIVVFVPPESIDAVSDAMADAGAGVIGEYTHCGFRTEGTGTFIPQKGAKPYSGELLKLNMENEIRLEMICPSYKVSKVVSSMISVHPYEEVAYDLYALENPIPWGIGRIGMLPEAEPCKGVIQRASGIISSEPQQVIGDDGKKARLVAVAPGDAEKLVSRVADRGADLLIAGEIGYHSALIAEEAGICVALYGHSESEKVFLKVASSELSSALEACGKYVKITSVGVDLDIRRGAKSGRNDTFDGR